MLAALHPAFARVPALVDPVAQLGGFLYEMWDAEVAGDFTIATGVSAWAGRKGVLTLAQGTGSLQPIRSATSFGGGAGVTFDGVDDQLTVSLAGQLPTGAAEGEIWALFSSSGNPATSDYIVAYGGADDNTARRMNIAASTNLLNGAYGTGSGQVGVNSSFTFAVGRHFGRLSVIPQLAFLHLNGLILGTQQALNTPNTTGTRLRFGASANNAASGFFGGQIAAVLFTNRLPPALAFGLNGYLQRRRRL